MEKKTEISVIMLVFNTPKKLLEKSIGSVLAQTQKNIELVIVNDCSTRKETLNALSEFEKKYKNIKVVNHDENHGMLRGRLTGLKNSSGEYVAFLDSDDSMEIDLLRKMKNAAVKNKADVVVCPFVFDYDENGEKAYLAHDPFINKEFDLKGDEISAAYFNQQGKCFSWTLTWNKLYDRKLLEKTFNETLNFSEKHNGLNMTEDVAFTTPVFLNAFHMVSIKDDFVYYYTHQKQSIQQNKSYKKWLKNVDDVSAVFGFVEEELKKYEKFEENETNLKLWKNHYVRTYSTNKPANHTERETRKYLTGKFNLSEFVDFGSQNEDYYYTQQNFITNDLKSKTQLYEKIVNPKTKVVSFDIFDTLLLRNVFEPSDIFRILGVEYNKINKGSYINLADIRITAESEARKLKKDNEDIVLDDIYNYMNKFYFFDKKECEFLKKKEQELELKFVRERKFCKQLFELSKYLGKKVILTSDMYLSKEFIEKLLKKCGYEGYDEFFLSNEIGKTKHTGNLFKHIVKVLGVKPSSILHIGDNYAADFTNAVKNHLQAHHIENVREKFWDGPTYRHLFIENPTFTRNQGFVERTMVKNMYGLINNKVFDNPYIGFNPDTMFNASPAILGYSAVGMELVSLNHWIQEHSTNSAKIHFVARDGYLPMRAFEELRKYNSELPQSNYFYMSRKALFPLDIACQDDLRSIPAKMNFKSLSPKKLTKFFKEEFVDVEKIKKLCEKKGIGFEEKFKDYPEFFKGINLFTDDVVNYKKHREYSEQIIKKFKDIVSPNNKFFDIGYSGRAESVITKILGYPVDSLYIHTNLDTAETRSQMAGFKIDCFLKDQPKVTGTIREHIFMKYAPSLIGYKLENNELKYIFEELKFDQTTKAVTEMVQDEAIKFVQDFYSLFYDYIPWFAFQENFISFPYERYLNNPMLLDKRIFECAIFEDDMGFGKKSMMEMWESQDIQFDANMPSSRAAQKIAIMLNKMFPVGTKRRKFAKKCYNGLRKIRNAFRRKK
ncbi:MAG: glycosyltransferase [Clostridia bacterium]|nr:glycosyltransferase [Clostridia bacterium]